MIANEARIVLNVIAGSSDQMSRSFMPGVPVPPFSVGACGAWKISAPDVDGAHFYLAFDGQRLHIAAVSPESNLFVLGVEIRTAFVPLPAPCVLFFGGACIAISAQAKSSGTVPLSGVRRPRTLPDLSRTGQIQTQLFDVSQAMLARTQRLELSPSLLGSLGEAPSVAAPTAEQTARLEVLPARITTLSGTLDLASTLYDGGALRERAKQLASGTVTAPVVPPPPAVNEGSAPRPAERRNILQKPLAAVRRASVVGRIAFMLAPLAVAIGVWDLRGTGSLAAAAGAAARPRVMHPIANSAPRASASASQGTAPPALARVTKSENVVQPLAASLPSDALERAALAAAFSGNRAEAALLYDRLASTRKARVFELAARLARADRVRKP